MSNTTNAKFYNLPIDVIVQMDAARDGAAREFWAYPGEGWQYAFEEAWLRERGHNEAADKAAECAAEVA